MASLFGVTCGLLAFAGMILRGLFSGNAVEVILLRAMGGLFGFLIIGTIAGWIAGCVLQDRPLAESEEDGKSR
ncbi:MAG: hypothetical protein KF841_01770 [Phycisphaerae bacterium]|nr:hypothetical protein [Phycisphaerae bacterium]